MHSGDCVKRSSNENATIGMVLLKKPHSKNAHFRQGHARDIKFGNQDIEMETLTATTKSACIGGSKTTLPTIS